MTTATSLMFIAVGAVLAFAVSTQVAGINIQTVGIILIIVGGIGLAVALATMAGYSPWAAGRNGPIQPAGNAAPTTNVAVSAQPAAPAAAPVSAPPAGPPAQV
jgi:hypothetical protein